MSENKSFLLVLGGKDESSWRSHFTYYCCHYLFTHLSHFSSLTMAIHEFDVSGLERDFLQVIFEKGQVLMKQLN